MPWSLISVTVTVLFALFGFYCALQTLARMLAPPMLATAILILRREDVSSLDSLLHEARSIPFLGRRYPIIVLISSELMDGTVGVGEELHPQYERLLEACGADCYLIDPE